MSLFITFEGVEGTGKTTQIERLRKYLTQKGLLCKVTREPGGPPISEKIRKILLDPAHKHLSPLSELFLYEAARAQHVVEVIQPLLRKGTIVLCDRFSDATLAYQGYGRGLNLSLVKKINRLASQGIEPDLTFLLDCPLELGLKRARKRNRTSRKEKEGRFEEESIQFHRRVRKGYLEIARRNPHRVKVIDTRVGPEKVFKKIQGIVEGRLIRRPRPKTYVL
ncbi:MAG: dTMP kinase [Desulfobacterota bacterium]|nr:dTMP kinase [Thermodesulfobacteriota bacterium]